MRYCLMNSFYLYWNQERRFPMNKIRSTLICLILMLMSCAKNKKIDKTEIMENYKISDNLKIQFYDLDYDTFVKKQENKDFDYPILISRPDCNYCISAIQAINNKAIEREKTVNLYLLNSNEIEPEDKQKMIDEYYITSVPTVILMDNHSISEVQTGHLTDDLFIKLIGGE